MEMADIIAINKADGQNVEKADIAKAQYKNAIHLFPAKDSEWAPQVLTCSAYHKLGIEAIWEQIENYKAQTRSNGHFFRNRNAQATYWMHETIQEHLRRSFYDHPEIKEKLKVLENYVMNDAMSSFVAAGELIDLYSKLR